MLTRRPHPAAAHLWNSHQHRTRAGGTRRCIEETLDTYLPYRSCAQTERSPVFSPEWHLWFDEFGTGHKTAETVKIESPVIGLAAGHRKAVRILNSAQCF
jgi:hypothetical protein